VTLLVDTSVLVTWFHEQGKSEVESARQLLAAHLEGRERVIVLDLVTYELGNVLLRPLGLPTVVTERLRLLLRLVGPLVHPRPSWLELAAALGAPHLLSFYDCSWAAAAQALDCPLVTVDRQLLAAGLAVTATTAAALPGLRRRAD